VETPVSHDCQRPPVSRVLRCHLKSWSFGGYYGVCIGLTAVALGTSCSQDLRSQPLPTRFEYLHFENGRVVEKASVREGDPGYDVVEGFLKNPAAGWNLDVNSYAPALSFTSENMIINCRDDVIVVNIGSNRMKQLVSHQTGCKAKVLEATSRKRGATSG